jgi:16S rRNA (cytosine967-C5)-methyltransferase
MKPGARVQAAIEILEAFDKRPKPLERMLKGWGRANRYAGSKDRRAIGEYAYSIMRARSELVHKMGSAEPRALMIALLAREGDETWKTWFDGENHNPAPLTMDEVKRLVADETEKSTATKLNIPDWLEDDIKETFGSDASVAMAAMAARAPVDLRANALRCERLEAHDALAAEGIETGGTPLATLGLRVLEATSGARPNIEHSDAYKKGLVEVQDEGSQLAAMIAGAKPGEQVIDLCAGAGGKTLAMAASMGNHGQIFACDTEGPKLKNLKPRLSRAGARNVQVRKIRAWAPQNSEDVDPDLFELSGAADLVFLDVPCSGSGTWRRHPDARWRLTEEDLNTYCAVQVSILKRGATLVKPGGRLVYVTCSVLARENEEQVSRFLAANPDFAQSEIDPSLPGIRIKGSLQMAPHVTGTDGFFVAVLKKTK